MNYIIHKQNVPMDVLNSCEKALSVYKKFYHLEEGSAQLEQLINSPEGIVGWSKASTYEQVDSGEEERILQCLGMSRRIFGYNDKPCQITIDMKN